MERALFDRKSKGPQREERKEKKRKKSQPGSDDHRIEPLRLGSLTAFSLAWPLNCWATGPTVSSAASLLFWGKGMEWNGMEWKECE